MLQTSTHAPNYSVMYYLLTAFDYEIRNHIDLEIQRLRKLDDPSEEDVIQLDRFMIVRNYLDKRRAELKP